MAAEPHQEPIAYLGRCLAIPDSRPDPPDVGVYQALLGEGASDPFPFALGLGAPPLPNLPMGRPQVSASPRSPVMSTPQMAQSRPTRSPLSGGVLGVVVGTVPGASATTTRSAVDRRTTTASLRARSGVTRNKMPAPRRPEIHAERSQLTQHLFARAGQRHGFHALFRIQDD